MKNETLPHLHFPKLKSVLQKAKEMLAYCTCIIAEMLIAIVSHQSERSICPSATPCSPSHMQPKQRAEKCRCNESCGQFCHVVILLLPNEYSAKRLEALWRILGSRGFPAADSGSSFFCKASCPFVALRGEALFRMASAP